MIGIGLTIVVILLGFNINKINSSNSYQLQRRVESTTNSCLAQDGINRTLRGIIITSSGPQPPQVEKLFQQFGLPGPVERLQQAIKSAQKLPIVSNCHAAAVQSVYHGRTDLPFPLSRRELKHQDPKASATDLEPVKIPKILQSPRPDQK